MSGALSWTPIQVPNFNETLAQTQAVQANRLAMLAQQRQLQQGQAMDAFMADNAAGFAASDPSKRMNLLAQLAGMGQAGARIALPMIQDLREDMEFRGMGAPSPAAPGAPAPAGSPLPGGGGAGFEARLIADESGGNPNARNPRSTATGLGQFIDGTWRQFVAARPDLFRGMTPDQAMAARTNPDIARQAIQWYRETNTEALRAQGLPANDGTVALAHRFGSAGAAQLLRADPAQPVAAVVGEQVMRANPDLAGRTVGDVVGRYAQRFGGGEGAPAAPGAPAQRGEGASLPTVPGFDMAMVQRAMSMPNNERARRYLASYFQAAQLLQRGEPPAPVEVADPSSPTGRRLVGRAEATGMPAPAPERNLQTVTLGDDAPEGPGIYAVEGGRPTRRLGAAPGDPAAAPFNRENTLRDEFRQLTGDFRTVQTAWQNIQSAARSSTGAGDMSLLYSFVKLLDPGSVVRESEFASAAASGSFGERIQGAVQRILSGERLPDSLRQSFLTEARSIFDNNRRSYDRLSASYRELAQRNRLNPDNIVLPFAAPDAEPGGPVPAGQPPAPGGAAPAAGQRTEAPAAPPQAPPPQLQRAQDAVAQARRELPPGAPIAVIERRAREILNGR